MNGNHEYENFDDQAPLQSGTDTSRSHMKIAIKVPTLVVGVIQIL